MLHSSFLALLEIWQAQLKAWAAEGAISQAALSALALEGEQPLLKELESAWAAGDFSGLPPVVLLPASSMPGAAGAYAASTGTIYINQDWLNTASEEQVQAVLTEELGQYLDDLLNEIDTPGDEGELFARQLIGQELSAKQQQAISRQNDQIQILVDGQTINAEASEPTPDAEWNLLGTSHHKSYSQRIRIDDEKYLGVISSPTSSPVDLVDNNGNILASTLFGVNTGPAFTDVIYSENTDRVYFDSLYGGLHRFGYIELSEVGRGGGNFFLIETSTSPVFGPPRPLSNNNYKNFYKLRNGQIVYKANNNGIVFLDEEDFKASPRISLPSGIGAEAFLDLSEDEDSVYVATRTREQFSGPFSLTIIKIDKVSLEIIGTNQFALDSSVVDFQFAKNDPSFGYALSQQALISRVDVENATANVVSQSLSPVPDSENILRNQVGSFIWVVDDDIQISTKARTVQSIVYFSGASNLDGGLTLESTEKFPERVSSGGTGTSLPLNKKNTILLGNDLLTGQPPSPSVFQAYISYGSETVDQGSGSAGVITADGGLQEGVTLIAPEVTGDPNGDVGVWSEANPEYQWLKDGVAITGATGSSYQVPVDAIAAAEEVANYSVEIVYTDGEGFRNTGNPISATAVSVEKVDNGDAGYQLQTNGAPISGVIAIGSVITAAQIANDVDGKLLNGSSVVYEWQTAESGTEAWSTVGTESTYTATTADSGKDLQLLIRYRDGQGYEEELAPLTAAVNDAPTGLVTISGTATEGQVLTASNTIADADGLGTISYQWKRDGSAISGATASTYTLIQDDVGAAITVTASYSDGQGTAESVTSTATSAVGNVITSDVFLVSNNSLTNNWDFETGLNSWSSYNTQIDGDGYAYLNIGELNQSIQPLDNGKNYSIYMAGYQDSAGNLSASLGGISFSNYRWSPGSAGSGPNDILPGQRSGAGGIGGGARNFSHLRYFTNDGTVGSDLSITATGIHFASISIEPIDNVFSVPENVEAGYVVATIDFGNDHSGQDTTFYPYASPGGYFEIQGNQLVTNRALDFEGFGEFYGSSIISAYYYLTASGTPYIEPFVVNIVNVDEPGVIGEIDVVGSSPSENRDFVLITEGGGLPPSYGPTTFSGSADLALGVNGQLPPSEIRFIDGLFGERIFTYDPLQSGNSFEVPGVFDVSPKGLISWRPEDPNQSSNYYSAAILYTSQSNDYIKFFWYSSSSEFSVGGEPFAHINYGTPGRSGDLGQAISFSVVDAIASYLPIDIHNTLIAPEVFSDPEGLTNPNYRYIWRKDGIVLTGEESRSLLPLSYGAGDYSVDVTYTDDQGYTRTLESEAIQVVRLPIKISGTAREDQVLTALNTIADEDGLETISYQWKRDGSAISGATASTYTLIQDDVGSAITVTAIYSDGQGTAESVTSNVTSAVVNVNDAPTGLVTISGTATEDQVLTASNTIADADGLGTISYQWKRDGSAIRGATASTYTLIQDDVGAAITVTASYTDGQGTTESLTSRATSAVGNVNNAPTNLLVSATSLVENITADSVVATFSTTDQDSNETFTYSLVSGTGDNDNSSFTIDGDQLKINASPDDETQDSYSVRVKTEDSGGLTFEKAFTLDINDAILDIIKATKWNNGIRLKAPEVIITTEGLNDNPNYSYQWLLAGEAIQGATSEYYYLGGITTGLLTDISVEVVFTDATGFRNTESPVIANPVSVLAFHVYDEFGWDESYTPEDALTGNYEFGTSPSIFTSSYGSQDLSITSSNSEDLISLGTLVSNFGYSKGNQNLFLKTLEGDDQVLINGSKASYMPAGWEYFPDWWEPSVSYQQGIAVNSGSEINLGSGDDFLQIIGSYFAVQDSVINGGSGNNRLYFSSKSAPVAHGAEVRLIENSIITTGDDADELSFSATASNGPGQTRSIISTDVQTGGGDDVVQFNPAGGFNNILLEDSSIDLGDGNDSIVIFNNNTLPSSIDSRVLGGKGLDSILIETWGSSLPTSLFSTTSYITDLQEEIDSGTIFGIPLQDSSIERVAITGQLYEDDFINTFSISLHEFDLPFDFTLSNHSYDENITAGSTVATFSSTDPDDGETFTYSLVSGTGDTDNSAFSIDGDQLKLTASPDHETQESYSIRVHTEDSGGLTFEKAFTFAVNDLNEDPTNLLISASAFDENITAGSTVATFSSTDPDDGETFTYSLVSGTGDTDNSAFSIDGDQLKLTASPDHETQESYSIRVHTEDSGGLTFEKAFTFAVNVNDEPIGSVTISGIAAEDEVLTAANTIADEDGIGTISYQWKRDGLAISDAIGSTYSLNQDDVGAVITVTASYRDGEGTEESVTSSATSAVVNVNDEPIGSVTISGIVAEDEILTAANTIADEDGIGTISYQWKRDGLAISDAIGSTYSLNQDDVGAVITVTASYRDGEGTEESVTSSATSAVVNVNDEPIGSVTISGIVAEDEILTAANTIADEDGIGTISYQWKRDGLAISDAIGSTYSLNQDDVGAVITVTASYRDGEGTEESVTSSATSAVVNVNDEPIGSVTISGIVAEDEILTAANTIADEDGIGTISYQWKRDGLAISDAIGSTYSLNQDDVGAVITVTASYRDGEGTEESVTSSATSAVVNVNDEPIGSVTISGIVAEDEILTAANTIADEDGIGTISYQWKRDGLAISDAIGSTYSLNQDDVGAVITVTASYRDGEGTGESVTSSATSAVVNVNDEPIGSVTISGIVAEDEILTAANTIADEDGIGTISYQWKRDGLAISDAIGSTYSLNQDDVGAVITVTASYRDGEGTEESVTSSATSAVVNVNDEPIGSVTISGIVAEDEILTAANTIADEDGIGTISYQWKRDGLAISDAIGSTYSLNQDDVGAVITVTASYRDGEGTEESVTSSATSAVETVDQGSGSPGVITADGGLQEGVTLIAPEVTGDPNGDVGVWSEANPEYQWLKDGVAIAGATGPSFVVPVDAIAAANTSADYSVEIVYTDGEGFRNSDSPVRSSAAEVAKIDNGDATFQLQVGGSAFSGAVEIGTEISATRISGDVDGNLLNGSSVGYEWQVAAAGTQEWSTVGTESTYTATTADSGKDLQLLISYRDGQDYLEELAPFVVNVNDVPILSGTPAVLDNGTEDLAYTINASDLLQGYSDADGDTLSVSTLTSSVGSLADNGNGTWTLSSPKDFNGNIDLSYSVTDGNGGSIDATQSFSLAPVNDAPIPKFITTKPIIIGQNHVRPGERISGVLTNDGLLRTNPSNSEGLFSTAKLESGKLYISGSEKYGGNGTDAFSHVMSDVAEVHVVAEGTFVALSNKGDLKSFGNWSGGGVEHEKIQTIATSASGFIALDSDGILYGHGSYQPDDLTKGNFKGAKIFAGGYGGYGLIDTSGNFEIWGYGSEIGSNTVAYKDTFNAKAIGIGFEYGKIGIAFEDGSAFNIALSEYDKHAYLPVLTNGTEDLDYTINASDLLQGYSDADGDTLSVSTLTSSVGSLADNGNATWTLSSPKDFNGNIDLSYSVTDGNGGSIDATQSFSLAPVNDEPTGSVTISGIAAEDQVLSAANTIADEDGLGTISYQWKRDGSAISGATGSSYSLYLADVGYPISVTASYIDGGGTEESFTSSPTPAIAESGLSISINGTSTSAGLSSYSNQDIDSDAVLSNDDNTLTLTGNTWTKADLSTDSSPNGYTITEDTVLSFSFDSFIEGEIQGIGFDNDDIKSPDQTFQLAGTQSDFGLQDFNTYSTGSGQQTYTIPVGTFFTGDFQYLTFLNDDDNPNDQLAPAQGTPLLSFDSFSDIQLFENSSNSLSLSIGGTETTAALSSYSSQDIDSDVVLSNGDSTLTLSGNTWTKADLATDSSPDGYTITENTVLSFSFDSASEGEIQGIGFDNDDIISPTQTFQLAGSQTWGLQDFDTYSTGSGAQTYTIPVGDFLTGDFQYLTFLNDADTPNDPLATDSFSNIQLYENSSNSLSLSIGGTETTAALSSYSSQDIDSDVVLSNGDSTLTLSGNTWTKADLATDSSPDGYTITENTVLSFSFDSASEGEIQGIGFDNDDIISPTQTFQLAGTQTWGLQDFDTYSTGSGAQSYTIPVGDFLAGEYQYLTFLNDDDTPNDPLATDSFSDIQLFEASNSLNLSIGGSSTTAALSSYSSQDIDSDVVLSNGDSILTLSGNTWTKADLATDSSPDGYTITENTVLSFSFDSASEGEIQGIGFDNDDIKSPDQTFQLAGSQTWGLQDFDTYSTGSGQQTYAISVGDFYTGDFQYLTFLNDADTPNDPLATDSFSNIQLYENSSNSLSLSIGGTETTAALSSYSSQDIDSGVVLSNGDSTLTLTGNTWTKADLATDSSPDGYTITQNTVLSFSFDSASEGEIQGIGFDNDDIISPTQTFQLAGSQTWGLQDFDTYSTGSGAQTYTIPVGDFLTGDFQSLTFLNDADTPNDPLATDSFSNIQLYENSSNSLSLSIGGTETTAALSSYSSQDIDSDVVLSNGDSILTLSGNTWTKADLATDSSPDGYTITENTVLSFSFDSASEGEIQGIGFDNDDIKSPDQTFQLAGTQSDFGLQDFNTYSTGSGQQTYTIPVGTFFTGDFQYLTFLNDDDTPNDPLATDSFSDIQLFEASNSLNLSIGGSSTTAALSSYSDQDIDRNAVLSNGDNTLTLTGNTWTKADLATDSSPSGYTITENTVLSFSFDSASEGEIQGIGFDNDDIISPTQTFQLAGTQTWGLQDFDTYSTGSGAQSYTIPVGDFLAGEYQYLTFLNDADTPNDPLATDSFSNIQLYEDASNSLNLSIDGTETTAALSSYSSQDIDSDVVLSNGDSTLTLSGNTWTKADLATDSSPDGYTITENTVLSFFFDSASEGEIQGIGFDNDDIISPTQTFQLAGTQTWGLQDFDTYSTGSGAQSYTIPVGDFLTGDFQYLTFLNDDDTPNDPLATDSFSDIQLYDSLF